MAAVEGAAAATAKPSVLRDAARWCVSAGLALRRLSLRDGAVDLQFYDAQTHGVRLCFWDAYAQAVRPGRARTLRPADALCAATPHARLTRSSSALDAAQRVYGAARI